MLWRVLLPDRRMADQTNAGGLTREEVDEQDVRAVGRAYRPDTVTLTTTWALDGGELALADSQGAEVEGRFLPGTLLVRRRTANGRPGPAPRHHSTRNG